jgi:hypothetical protein
MTWWGSSCAWRRSSGLLAWRRHVDRRQRAAADVHAGVVRAFGGETLLAIDVPAPTAWRSGHMRLSTPSGYEPLVDLAFHRLLERLPDGYQIVIHSGERVKARLLALVVEAVRQRPPPGWTPSGPWRGRRGPTCAWPACAAGLIVCVSQRARRWAVARLREWALRRRLARRGEARLLVLRPGLSHRRHAAQHVARELGVLGPPLP